MPNPIHSLFHSKFIIGQNSIFQKHQTHPYRIMDDTQAIKARLYNYCLNYVENRIETATNAMNAAQAAANAESKSSAGDKYETTRAMMQIEKGLHTNQLAESMKLKKELERINIGNSHNAVMPGNLVFTESVCFFIAISAGKITLDGREYLAVSANSPIGTKLAGMKTGDEITFNAQTLRIRAIG